MTIPFETVVPTVVTIDDGDLGGTLSFSTFALNESTGDILIPLQLIHGVAAIRQRILSRLRFFKREWFLDLRLGMPYYQVVFIKNPSIPLVTSVFRRAILSTPGVLSIPKIAVIYDKSARTLTIDPLEIVLTGNKVFRAQPDEFIIGLTNAIR